VSPGDPGSRLTAHGLWLIRGHIIDPDSNYDAPGDVVVFDGRIAYCGPPLEQPPSGTEVLDATGCVVTPGFVDLHTHLRFPGFPEKETIASGTAAAAAGGFTTVCAMANTDPVVDRVEVLREVLHEIEQSAVVRVRQLAAVSYGLRGEELTDMPALAAAGAVAFSDDGKPVWSETLMRTALDAGARLAKPISVHEEDPEIVRGGVANAGPAARRLGLAEWPCRGEASIVARDLSLLAQTGGRLHIAHVSCAETVPLIERAKHAGLPVTAEVTPHHLRLSDCLLAGNYPLGLPPAHPCVKVNPPLRSDADVEAMIEALSAGTIDAVATDHAPHAAADKTGPFTEAAFGISAIETALPLLLDLVRSGRFSMSDMVARLTAGPARAFRLDGGTLTVGAPADICVFDPEEEWTVAAHTLRSKGKNTPLLGATLRGRVRWTMVAGVVVPGNR
jgi:dihydroorotase